MSDTTDGPRLHAVKSEGNVHVLPSDLTNLDLPADRVLHEAGEQDLISCIVAGWTDEGEFYFHTSPADIGACLLLLSRARRELEERIP